MFEGFDGWLSIKDDSTFSEPKPYTVSELIEHCNFLFERELSDIYVEGEVSSFKVNQGKWVFFDLKEADSTVSCFMVLSQLNIALADGMRVRVKATPRLTRWGKFSLTIKRILPLGEGSIKKSFELLKRKLAQEGLFDLAKKRPLPPELTHIGVISSTAAAGYHDFLKILDNRWGGLKISTINTQVQGLAAPAQIIAALDFFNQQGKVDIIAILRGGGSADDLSAFNDEQLARRIAASRIPVITGIGHEVDESLADLAADIRASTPSNAAELLSPSRQVVAAKTRDQLTQIHRTLLDQLTSAQTNLDHQLQNLVSEFAHQIALSRQHVQQLSSLISSLNPETVLERGYAILRHTASPRAPVYRPGEQLELITHQQNLTVEVIHAQNRSNRQTK